MSKIRKILIANRGEIACRVIKTARRLGIKTVAVYSDADRNALHVRMADEAVHIGPSPAAESYLVINKILQACKDTGADAVHPGYGFLSENPAFARALKKAGVTFIGPAPESMEAMGLKDAAKKLMVEAGVPVTPGYHGEDQDPEFLKKQADEIGYPVLIKAVAGGGGKGMRKVEVAEDFEEMLASCQREAKSSFADDRVLIEKYITSPRHIEVQVFGDTKGNVIHLFERDCSLQRRHQKVIEEAPAPGMTDAVRAAMTKAAVNAAKAVDYVGAGTVEFIVDGSGPLREDGFWFMEMNTRLQVEHPVTEMITGLDLVELQIRIAEGKPLPDQKKIKMSGHAIEARLYAEDPANDFLPSVGRLEIFDFRQYCRRVDTGVEQGDEISVYYDPMIAKLIAHEPHRVPAIERLKFACQSVRVYPPKCNLRFIVNCLDHESFEKGEISTHFIDQYGSRLKDYGIEKDLTAIEYALAPTYAAIGKRMNDLGIVPGPSLKAIEPTSPFANDDGWRLNLQKHREFVRSFKGETLVLSLDANLDQAHAAYTYRRPEGDVVFVKGNYYLIGDMGGGELVNSTGGNAITAPMPGKIIAVNAAAGDAVKAGDTLVIMEAMKMEMSLDAPRDGAVAAIHFNADDLVGDGDVILELEDE